MASSDIEPVYSLPGVPWVPPNVTTVFAAGTFESVAAVPLLTMRDRPVASHDVKDLVSPAIIPLPNVAVSVGERLVIVVELVDCMSV